MWVGGKGKGDWVCLSFMHKRGGFGISKESSIVKSRWYSVSCCTRGNWGRQHITTSNLKKIKGS